MPTVRRGVACDARRAPQVYRVQAIRGAEVLGRVRAPPAGALRARVRSSAYRQSAERKSWVVFGSRTRLPSARTVSVGMIRQTRTNRLLKGEGCRPLSSARKNIHL